MFKSLIADDIHGLESVDDSIIIRNLQQTKTINIDKIPFLL